MDQIEKSADSSEAVRVFCAQLALASHDLFPAEALRRDRLRRLLDLLLANEQKITDAVMADFGFRSPRQSFFVEVVTTAKPIKEALKNLRKWMRPQKRGLDAMFALAGAKAEVRYQPLGVVGCISPWNFPFNLSLAPLAGILAAGNRTMIKPSEATPASAGLMKELIAASFDEGEIAVITGGPEISREFAALPFDHLLYTGGEAVAKHVMRAASDNLTPVTLELGGKSPVILGKGANLKLAAERIIFGKMLNAGQICLAPDHLFVPAGIRQAFVAELEAAVRKMAPQENGATDFVSVVNEGHADRLRGYLAEAEQAGAQIIGFDWLTDITGVPRGDGKNLVPLTLVIDPPDHLKVMQEEIFGPILPIIEYSDINDVFARLRTQPSPLAIYYFGSSKQEIAMLTRNTRSGGVTINDVIMHYTIDTLPFGGIGPSGMGNYHGYDGFKRFSHPRAFYRQSPIDIGGALRPPYGAAFERVSRFLLKHG